MSTPAERLWWMNNEYRKRLGKLKNYLDLLDQLLRARGLDVGTLPDGLRTVQDYIATLTEEQRRWRYAYYYESGESKRMVQQDREILRALAYFNLMRAHHQQGLLELAVYLETLPRPEGDVTRIAGGDLWAMMEGAVADLCEFMNSAGEEVAQ
jgi:hypothetical protein